MVCNCTSPSAYMPRSRPRIWSALLGLLRPSSDPLTAPVLGVRYWVGSVWRSGDCHSGRRVARGGGWAYWPGIHPSGPRVGRLNSASVGESTPQPAARSRCFCTCSSLYLSLLMRSLAASHLGLGSHDQPSPVVLVMGTNHLMGEGPKTWPMLRFQPKSKALGSASLSRSSR